jgi:hypothetical protein
MSARVSGGGVVASWDLTTWKALSHRLAQCMQQRLALRTQYVRVVSCELCGFSYLEGEVAADHGVEHHTKTPYIDTCVYESCRN